MKVLYNFLLVTGFLSLVAAEETEACDKASLWDRMGGEEVIRPMVTEIYGLHTTDPLTKNWFGPHKFSNVGNDDHVINSVFTFFSAGIGGPYAYEGRSMPETHAGMKISEPAFHAICNHVISMMEKHGAGGVEEREEVLAILYSLKPIVLSRSNDDIPEGFIKFDANI